MGYPRRHLAPGEAVALHRHPHWRVLVAPLAGFAVVTLVVGILGGIVGGSTLHGWMRTAAFAAVGMLWALALLWCVLRPLTSWASTHFVVTDRRVVYRNGLLRRSGLDIPLSRINTVEFHRGMLDRMLGSGTLVVESASDDPLVFRNVPDVERAHALLYQEVLDERDPADAGLSRELR